MTVEIRTAAELLTPESAAEVAARRAQRDDPVLRAIWRQFAERGGPVAIAWVAAARPDVEPSVLRSRLAALDVADLVELDGDRIRLAYPFTGAPNDFEVVLPGRGARHACCATDALGLAPMLGLTVTVRARCHWSGAPLVFEVDPVTGPHPGPSGSLVWVERRRLGGDRLSGYL